LRISHAARGAEDAQELITLTANAGEHSQLLKNHGPGDDGKDKQEQQNAASDPASLRENISDVGGKDRCEQKNDEPLSENEIFLGVRNVAYAPSAFNL
jgi:hypothetical protein